MEIQDLNVGVFQNGMGGEVQRRIVRGTAQTRGYSSRKRLRSCACVSDSWQVSCRIAQEAGSGIAITLYNTLYYIYFLFPFYFIDVIVFFCK